MRLGGARPVSPCCTYHTLRTYTRSYRTGISHSVQTHGLGSLAALGLWSSVTCQLVLSHAMPDPTGEYDPDEMAAAIRQEDGVVKDAAQVIGCSERTIHRYRHKHEQVEEAIQEMRPVLVSEMRTTLKEIARDWDHKDQYRSAVKLLTVLDDDHDWADRRRTDITSGGEPVSSIQLQVVETDADSFEQERQSDS